jgi:hypothetical protein
VVTIAKSYLRNIFSEETAVSSSMKSITVLVEIILLSLYMNSIYAQEDIFTSYFSVQVPDGWVYRENFLTDNSTILTTSEFANLLSGNKPAESFLDVVQRGVLLELGIDEDFHARNASLEKYVKYFLSDANDEDVLLQNASVGGERAIRVFINGTDTGKSSPMKDVTGSINSISYLFFHLDAPHYIYYIANEKDFENYLPQFEKIVKTFRFTK